MLGSLRRGLGQKVGDEENRAEACSARGVVMRRQLGKSISLTAVEVNHGENALLDLGISDDDSVVTAPAEIRRKALSGGRKCQDLSNPQARTWGAINSTATPPHN